MNATAEALPGPDDEDVLDALLTVAERTVESARSRGAEAAEAFVQTGIGRSWSIEKNAVSYVEMGGEAGLGLRVLRDGRTGFAYFSDPAMRDEAAARALRVAARAAPTPFRFPSAAPLPVVADTWDHRLVEYDTARGLADAKALIAAAREVHKGVNVSGGALGVGAGASAIVNSEGLAVAERGTSFGAHAYVVLKSGKEVATGSESHQCSVLDAAAKDPAALGRKAAELARESLGAKAYGAGGLTTVLLRPDAAAALIEFTLLPSFLGERVARGESRFSGQLGKGVVDRRIHLVDDPTRDGGLGSSTADDEGLPSRPVALLDAGRVGAFLYDVGSAHEYGGGQAAATASAVRAGGLSDDRSYQDPPTTGTRNVVLRDANARAFEALLSSIDEGVYVHDLLGAHTANATSGDFSVSSTVAFRIRKGAIAEPISGIMLAGNLPEILAKGWVGASVETEKTGGHFSPGALELGHVAILGVQVVGA